MIQTIGMIGTGNMGSAILRGIVEADYVKAGQIVAYDTSSRRIRELEEDIPGIISAVRVPVLLCSRSGSSLAGPVCFWCGSMCFGFPLSTLF